MKRIRIISTIVVLCLGLSFVWCGDADCLDGTSTNNCASLVCSTLVKHKTPSNEKSTTNVAQCSCVCHVPLIEHKTAVVRYAQFVELVFLPYSFAIPSAPAKVVYRPPIAA